MADTRIYSVQDTSSGKTRLVEACNKSQAIRHVAQSTLAAEVAGQKELVMLLKQGIEIEQASESSPTTGGSDEQ